MADKLPVAPEYINTEKMLYRFWISSRAPACWKLTKYNLSRMYIDPGSLIPQRCKMVAPRDWRIVNGFSGQLRPVSLGKYTQTPKSPGFYWDCQVSTTNVGACRELVWYKNCENARFSVHILPDLFLEDPNIFLFVTDAYTLGLQSIVWNSEIS